MKKFNMFVITLMAVTFFTMSGISCAKQAEQTSADKAASMEEAKDTTVKMDNATATAMNTEIAAEEQEVNKKININTATATELSSLPEIDEETAKSIVAFRDANGLFKNVNELLNIKGVDAETLDRIKDHLTVQ